MPTPDNGPAQGAVDLISNLRQLNGTFAAREQKVADFVSAHLEEISGMTIAELAGAVGVSTPTVVRFCRSMGCDGFREFKLRLAQNLYEKDRMDCYITCPESNILVQL